MSNSPGIISTQGDIIIENNPNQNNSQPFHANIPNDPNNNGGYQDPNGNIVVTLEAEDILLTDSLYNQLKISNHSWHSSTNNPNITLAVGMKINVYLIYLNSSNNKRTAGNKIFFLFFYIFYFYKFF